MPLTITERSVTRLICQNDEIRTYGGWIIIWKPLKITTLAWIASEAKTNQRTGYGTVLERIDL